MDTAIEVSNKLESVLIQGDLAHLKPEERVMYYKNVCQSVGLNPLTKPFDYITLNGKLTLYAKKDATDQLRNRDGVSITALDSKTVNDIYLVTAHASRADGRTDASTGAVNIAGLKGDALANALMKAETKAKRRVTLSICGLGLLDETEIETIRDATPTVITDSGVIEPEPKVLPEPMVKRNTKDVMANNGHTRPYDPDVLKAKIADLILTMQDRIDKGEAASKDSDEFVITSHIEQVWAGDADAENKRHAVTEYLVGKKSIKEMTDAEKLALKHWLKITKDEGSGEWVHAKEAGIEADAVYRQTLVDQGQMTLID